MHTTKFKIFLHVLLPSCILDKDDFRKDDTMSTIYNHEPLHLYKNYEKSSMDFPNTKIFLDEKLSAFPEFGLETTYNESLTFIQKRAYQLSTIGIKPREKVMVYKSSAVDTYLLACAISYLGAIPLMTSAHLPASIIDTFFERLEDAWLIYDDETAEKVMLLQEKNKAKAVSIQEIQEQIETITPFVSLNPNEISYMTHTSGTTGIPKLIAHSANSMGWRTAFQKSIFSKMEEKGILAFHISPVHSRFNIGMSSLMSLGFPYLAIKDPSIQNIEKLLQQFQPIGIETHPNNFVQWATLAQKRPELFEHTRYYHSTFDAINKETMATFLKTNRKKNGIYLQIYGQSECGPAIIRKHTLESLLGINIRNMGVGFEHFTKARIATNNGTLLPINTPGNIQLYSKGRALTYFKEDERFQENVYDEWWDTGDFGMMNDNGELLLHDRQVDLVETLESTLAIEDYLLDHLPFLEEVVIIRDNHGYPQPIIAITDGEFFQEELWFKAIENLLHLNEPMIMDYDKIPRTATMKVQRRELEQLLFGSN